MPISSLSCKASPNPCSSDLLLTLLRWPRLPGSLAPMCGCTGLEQPSGKVASGLALSWPPLLPDEGRREHPAYRCPDA